MDEKVYESRARKGEGRMKDDAFEAIVGTAVRQAVLFVDGELSRDRAKATRYYMGDPFGNEEDGRSQVVLTEVADAVDGMVPSLARVFFGPEHCVEFVPTKAETVAIAEQATDYIRHVIEQDNAGFLRTVDVLKDGLIRKLGIFKWGWDSTSDIQAVTLEALTQEQMEAFVGREDVEPTHIQKRKDGLFDVSATTGKGQGRPRVWSVPPEEFIFNRNARSVEDAILVGHRTRKTKGQLLAMGVSEKDIEAHGGDESNLRDNPEVVARRPTAIQSADDPPAGEANEVILYTELLMRVDYDGDGIAEKRRICTIGNGFYPVSNVPADGSVGFSVFTPIPEPHTMVGRSIYDKTADIQKISSAILRTSLDSASASAFPRMAILEGQVSTADIMNTAIGAPIRERVMNAVRPLEVPFVADKLIPLLAVMQETVERRTGRNKGAAGLDADALQSTGKEAVGAVLSGGQEQIELIARVFAEMTLKPLFRGLYHLMLLKKPQPAMVRLRGQWVQPDPSQWPNDMDVTVNVALGSTFIDEKVATLMAVAADQKEFVQTMGPSNPVASLPMLVNTRRQILKLKRVPDVENYYHALPMNWQPPAPPPPPPPDPEQLWIQAEKEMNHVKTMKELAIKQDELTLKEQQSYRDYHLAVLRIEADVAMKKYAADAQFHAVTTDAALQHELQSATAEAEITMDAHDQLHDQTLQQDAQSHEQRLAEDAQSHAQQMAEQAPTGEA